MEGTEVVFEAVISSDGPTFAEARLKYHKSASKEEYYSYYIKMMISIKKEITILADAKNQ